MQVVLLLIDNRSLFQIGRATEHAVLPMLIDIHALVELPSDIRLRFYRIDLWPCLEVLELVRDFQFVCFVAIKTVHEIELTLLITL